MDQHISGMDQIERLFLQLCRANVSLHDRHIRSLRFAEELRIEIHRHDLAGGTNHLAHPGHDRPSARPDLKTAPAGLQTSTEQSSPTRRIEHPLDHPKPFQFPLIFHSLKDILRLGHAPTSLKIRKT